MSNLIEAGHWMEIQKLKQNIKGIKEINDALLALAWFLTWEDKSVQTCLIYYLKNKYIKEVILTLIAPEQSKLKILGLTEEGEASLYDLSNLSNQRA